MTLPEPLRKHCVRIEARIDRFFEPAVVTYDAIRTEAGDFVEREYLEDWLKKYHRRCIDKSILFEAVRKAFCNCKGKKGKCKGCIKISRMSDEFA